MSGPTRTNIGETVPAGSGEYVVAATGASGARLALRFVGRLCAHPSVSAVHFIPSNAFALVASREEDRSLDRLLAKMGEIPSLRLYREDQLDAPVASGSRPVRGTVVLPASMATVGAVASGAGRTLIHRVADVALKEDRPLILVPRETPLSLVHLKNLLALKEAGAAIAPFIPSFYHRPRSIEDLMDHFIMRLFDHLGLDCDPASRWS